MALTRLKQELEARVLYCQKIILSRLKIRISRLFDSRSFRLSWSQLSVFPVRWHSNWFWRSYYSNQYNRRPRIATFEDSFTLKKAARTKTRIVQSKMETGTKIMDIFWGLVPKIHQVDFYTNERERGLALGRGSFNGGTTFHLALFAPHSPFINRRHVWEFSFPAFVKLGCMDISRRRSQHTPHPHPHWS